MILLHRLTPFATGFFALAPFVLSSFFPKTAIWALPLALIALVLLLLRLIEFRVKEMGNWVLIGAPILFFVSSTLFFLFLEQPASRLFLAIIAGTLVTFYTEQIFLFTHLPRLYQPYALQNLTGMLFVLSMFFFVTGSQAVILFLRAPISVFAILFLLLSFAYLSMAYWMAKITREDGQLFALIGATLLAQLFFVVSYLPTLFFVNGALIAVCGYVYLGVTRARILRQLQPRLLRRYIGIGTIVFVAIVLTAQWI